MIYLLHNIGPGPTSNYNTREEIEALPSDAVLTFDGVYRSVYENRDLLEGRRVILFVIGAYAGADNAWDAGQPLERFCSWAELWELEDMGCEIGWHTLTHPDLTKCTDDVLKIQMLSMWSMKHFAYPYGKYDERVIAAVKAEGYQWAYTAGRGDGSQYQIKRRHI